ncbi:hypothetical protein GGR42_001504 [Saonia flava]|uniref:Por secretion system C-terminal sorting domain-containing protein n=1 Tax=Saonia flava TaxID=523696 RepID=A0A846QWT3_9FLAO|nr:DUF4114 domain-containing protein [Saonia flava]NJB71042.1 hypothetical protein [Saonia flava]
MKQFLLISLLSCFSFGFAQTGAVSNFSFQQNPIELGETINFSIDYVSDVDAYFSIALLKSQNNGSQINWSTGMHWQSVNVPASASSSTFNGSIHLSGFNETSQEIAPEVFLVMVQLVDRNTGSSMAAVNNWGVGPENTITILPSSDVFNYQYLGAYDNDGTPLYLETPGDVVTESELETINNSLPESFPVPEYNPQYITSGYDTDLILDDNADVWVTFITEGAGYTNVLGYYTYDINNPPTTVPNQEDITIIYPNASELGAGGGLQVGDKVKIGTFTAGTGIGWVLLANAWNGKEVAHDIWQVYSNPDFNPESDETLRHHNVLLKDPDNERIILGFEDVRRDLDWCDNDFNDAIFYVTANPYTALRTANYAGVTDATPISSANDGGLESNGDLATLIAKRNFTRNKKGTSKNTKKAQRKYLKKTYKSIGAKSGTLDSYFPQTGMLGTETTYVSSPEDLLEITNAVNIFSIDYYQEEDRVTAALATETKGGVYDHSKTICDRLNSSKLLDVRTVTLQGYKLVYSQIERATGDVEYALTFSIKQDGGNTLYSLWNLDQYPAGDYLNFQVWGSSMGQVTTIVNNILKQLKLEGQLAKNSQDNIVPTVFIQSGFYKRGKLHLNIVNKVNAQWMNLDGNFKRTEQLDLENMNEMYTLSGAWNEEIVVEPGFIFDIGLSITAENSFQYDAIYLADGPWGVDYDSTIDSIEDFQIFAEVESDSTSAYPVERSVSAKGQVKGTINVFRNILAGDLVLDITDYDRLQFKLQSDVDLEISLVTDATDIWEERLRTTIVANDSLTPTSIMFSEFKNHLGQSMDFTKLRTVVFSVQGDYENFKSFDLEVEAMALNDKEMLVMPTEEESVVQEEIETENFGVKSYPNPFTEYVIISFPQEVNEVQMMVSNLLGQVIHREVVHTMDDQKSVRFEANNLSNGMYVYTLVDMVNNRTYQGKLIKN